MNLSDKPVNIFWTGGWDSTFRILQLLIVKKLTVQPFYIIDPGRNSTLLEIRSMTKIRALIEEKLSGCFQLLLPTRFKNLEDIKAINHISESYKILNKQINIGNQYEWLARFCEEEGIKDMEFSLELKVNPEDNKIINLIGSNMEKLESESGILFRVNEKAKETHVYNLFGNMLFPLLSTTKKQMHEYAIHNHFDDLLNETWFCHLPIFKSIPCGKCNPCRSVVSEGLQWRLPFSAKLRYHTWPTLRKIAKTAGIYKWVQWK